MTEYVTTNTAARLLGHTHDKSLRLWVDKSDIQPAAYLKDYTGRKVKLYHFEDLKELAANHIPSGSGRRVTLMPGFELLGE